MTCRTVNARRARLGGHGLDGISASRTSEASLERRKGRNRMSRRANETSDGRRRRARRARSRSWRARERRPASSGSAASAPTCRARRRRRSTLGGRDRPRRDALRLFRARPIGRALRGRHHLALAGRGGGGLRPRPKARRSSIGSSMGGWIALLLAKRLAERGDSDRLARHGAARARRRHDQGPDVGRLQRGGEAASRRRASSPTRQTIRPSPTSSR